MTPAPQDVQATFCATLVDEWVRHGLRHAVVAPGSRSTPMALALAGRADIDVHVFHDERSAAFVALGVALGDRRAGGAAVHQRHRGHPLPRRRRRGTSVGRADAGAHRRPSARAARRRRAADHRPDQPVRRRGAVVPRSRRRRSTSSVRRGATARVRAWASRPRANLPGPVHLNLPFREPLGRCGRRAAGSGRSSRARRRRCVRRPTVSSGSLEPAHGVIVAGNGVDDPRSVQALADATGWPVLADPLSGCQMLDAAVVRFDSVLRHAGVRRGHRPRSVLQLGMPPASKVLAQWLGRVGCHACRRVAGRARVRSRTSSVHEQVHAPIGALCSRCCAEACPAASDRTWLERVARRRRIARAAIEQRSAPTRRLSEPGVGPGDHGRRAAGWPPRRRLVDAGARRRVVRHAASDSPCTPTAAPTGSTASSPRRIGVALGSGAPTVVLLGDVAFCHDSRR